MVIARVPIDLTWTGASGSPGVNVWHARYGGDPQGSAQMGQLLGELEAFYTTLRGAFPGDVTIAFNGVVTLLGTNEGQSATYPAWSMTGTSASGYGPPATATVISWQSDAGGRRGRGRTFIGPMAKAAIDDTGRLSTATQGFHQGAVDDLIDSFDGIGDGAFGVYSREDQVVRDFVRGIVRRDLGSLRSRRD